MHLPSIVSQASFSKFICLLAEVPCSSQVNLQPAEHLCFVNSFQKCVFQLIRFQAHQAQAGEGAGANLHQNLPWTCGDVLAKFD